MAYRKGSVNRLLQDCYHSFPIESRPEYGTEKWRAFLAEFQRRYPLEVSRMTEDLNRRAYEVLRHSMPNE